MSYERHLGTPPTKTLKPISRKKTLFCVEYSVWWVGVSASMPVEFVDDFGWGPCECCWSLNLFWKFVLLSAWTAEALALKCDVGIVMMTSKLKLWIKKRYVRVVCDVYCLFCVFVFVDKKKSPRPGIEPGTLWSSVIRSPDWAILASDFYCTLWSYKGGQSYALFISLFLIVIDSRTLFSHHIQ